ncbi:hypothetical protein ACHZ98_13125 [Streptomyces sp. MAR4 CNY-716]
MRAFAREFRKSRHRAAGCVAAAVLSIALAGCGTGSGADGVPLDEAMNTASAAASDATSEEALDRTIEEALDATFEEADTLTSTKRQVTGETAVLRTAVIDGTSVCDMGVSKGNARVEFLLTDSALYSRMSEVMLRRATAGVENFPSEMIEKLGDRWVKRAPHEFAGARESLCDRTEQRSGLEDKFLAPKNSGERKEQAGTLNGRATTKITFTRGRNQWEVHVAAEGPPYLLKISERGSVVWTFSDFDKPYRTSAPADAINEDELSAQLKAVWG